jgi:hypothetical protein
MLMDGKLMRRYMSCVALVLACGVVAAAQKGTAESGYYGMDYNGDTWTGEVTAVDNDKREITLTYTKGTKKENFIAVIPDGAFGWMKDLDGDRVLNFLPADKKAKPLAPEERADLGEFMGRLIKVYYIQRERKVDDQKVKINEVVRVKFLKSEKKQKKDDKQP